jgi:pimeloyl-ACP methyl ester carboxylesterase
MRPIAIAFLLAGLASCSRNASNSGSGSGTGSGSGSGTVAAAVETEGTMKWIEEPVELASDGRTVRGTLSRPDAPGKHPAVILIAGSGPTDRDWSSAALSGGNGSGLLLAHELSARGVVVLRYDKLGSGTTDVQPLALPLQPSVLDNEPRAALAFVAARPDVDPTKIFVAGHSEGGIYATRLASTDARVRGLLLLASAGRPMKDIVLDQLAAMGRHQAKQAGIENGDALVASQLAPIRADLDAFFAGQTVDATKYASALPLVATIVAAPTAPAVREIYGYDPIAGLAKLAGRPVLIVNGQKDVQVSPTDDAERLAKAAREAGAKVQLTLAPDADHVLKHEPKPFDQLYGQPSTEQGYNAAGRTLDAVILTAIVDFLRANT